ncbi:MAG: hypothetical protein GY725_07270 [bacterium]|nr:hypothetical protein [bacterium]
MGATADVLIIGAGFGGSLMALLTQRIGMKPILIERDSHPRFAIGESSTPQGDLVLSELARRYELPRIAPLSKYGSWRRSYPDLVCGLKRGFSYFHHVAGEEFAPREDHSNELLVAASPDDESADTHWLRSEFDAFLVDEVCDAGIPYFDRTLITKIEEGDRWYLEGRRDDQRIELRAPFVIDASGDGNVLAAALGIEDDLSSIHTRSRSLYGHFTGVTPWEEVYRAAGGRCEDHPFPSHAAALHQIFDGGWMYALRFDNGVTSAGFVLEDGRHPLNPARSPDSEWSELLRRFPSIAKQFQSARPLTPLTRTGRMQRRRNRVAGANWAMLPHAACFLDPLHSSGNALTLTGIDRLVGALETEGSARSEALSAYEMALFRDIAHLDRIIHGGYVAFGHFEMMATYSMLYFAGAHYSEHLRRRYPTEMGLGFLNSHDNKFFQDAGTAHRLVCDLAAHPEPSEKGILEAKQFISGAIEPYNLAGLCDANKRNMYSCLQEDA